MNTQSRTRWRRTTGLGALLTGIGLLVVLKSATGSSTTHEVALPPAAQAPATQTGSPTASGSDGAGSTSSSSPTSTPGGNRTVSGSVASTPYGPVQVQLVISNGKIVDVRALQLPSAAAHSRRVAAMAVPILRTEVLTAQSAQVDSVSGATYTSQGYAESVQYALDHG
ncbi:MAG TPA: FMN-binding protein [Pseudonocardiaceae bacterium]|nr:FMN-binding protein [Pseudonocardiaceae bacterium]